MVLDVAAGLFVVAALIRGDSTGPAAGSKLVRVGLVSKASFVSPLARRSWPSMAEPSRRASSLSKPAAWHQRRSPFEEHVGAALKVATSFVVRDVDKFFAISRHSPPP